MATSDKEKQMRSTFDAMLEGDRLMRDVEPWIWSQLKEGARSRSHVWNLGCLSTIGRDDAGNFFPRSRTVVVRSVDDENKTLDFHTDNRSAKMGTLSNATQGSEVCWLFYRHETRIQLRMDATCQLLGSEESQPFLENTPAESMQVYGSKDAPGSPLSPEGNGGFLLELSLAPSNFCVVRTRVHHIDLVVLNPDGNRRLSVDYQTGSSLPLVQWLVP